MIKVVILLQFYNFIITYNFKKTILITNPYTYVRSSKSVILKGTRKYHKKETVKYSSVIV